MSAIAAEMAPKRMGLNNPESIAMAVARPMHKMSILAGPAVNFLGRSTDALLRALGFKPSQSPTVTEEEVKVLEREGLRAGVFQEAETEMGSSQKLF